MYEWVKVLHIISFIAWMAGLLYLPRLMVYHADTEPGSDTSETLKIMERRLLRAIMTPAMLSTWLFGLWLMVLIEAWVFGWFAAKLVLVIVMSAMHGFNAKWVREFAGDGRIRDQKFFRIVNEIPTVLMILIVILVIVKPF